MVVYIPTSVQKKTGLNIKNPGNKEERIQKILNESNNFQCQSVGKLSLIV